MFPCAFSIRGDWFVLFVYVVYYYTVMFYEFSLIYQVFVIIITHSAVVEHQQAWKCKYNIKANQTMAETVQEAVIKKKIMFTDKQ